VSFHNFSLPEDRCVRLLIENLGKQMPEDFVREELETGYLCRGRLAARHWAPCPRNLEGLTSNPVLHCVCSAGTRGGETAFSDRTLRSASLDEDTHRPRKTPCSANAADALAINSTTAVVTGVLLGAGPLRGVSTFPL
jgi:hypothetical protein